MKNFNRIFILFIFMIVCIFAAANFFLNFSAKGSSGRPYRVEAARIAKEIEQKGFENIDLSRYEYVTNVEPYTGNDDVFFQADDSDYLVQKAGGQVYRFDYLFIPESDHKNILLMVNVILGIMSFVGIGGMIFVRQKILKPFELLRDVPYELSRGNLTVPVKENKSRFFGRFVWGVNMLRENMEQQRERELELQRAKKTLVLSISHDIKTPLSAIKLYAKALSRGLYKDSARQAEIAESINGKADEIEGFISEIIKASREDFLNLEVNPGEFYLSELVTKIIIYYNEKLELIKTEFLVGKYTDCILCGDFDRAVEVLQNIIENAIKYGDGHCIKIDFSEEEDCQLVTVKNSGCSLTEAELPHVFDSFWRGSNRGSNKGSGLGLYICRQLMHRMNGEIYDEIQGEFMCVTAVFRKAV